MRIPGIEAERSEPKGAEARGVALAVLATVVLALLVVGAAWITAVVEPEDDADSLVQVAWAVVGVAAIPVLVGWASPRLRAAACGGFLVVAALLAAGLLALAV